MTKPDARSWKRPAGILAALFALTSLSQAALQDGLVAYWPLDTVSGTKTPDLVSGYDMQLANLTAADLVDGKVGKAMKFDNARQTMLQRVSSPGEQLPINQHPALTIAFWANVTGTGQVDLRLFSEGSTANNNPLFNLGTANTGNDGTLDFYFRQAGWTDVNHLRSVGEPLDGTWHHITFLQHADGTRELYIDGVKDAVEIPAKAAGAWNLNTTTIGGILRANPTHWVTGAIDDVALWSRALTPAEIQTVVQQSLSSVFSPIATDMVAYWPLDEVIGSKTPDLASGYDMELRNLTAADLSDGKRGKAMRFDNARQTMLVRVSSPGEQLPINQHPALTISMWANVVGAGQVDLRLFSEASTANNNPLFNLGTANTGNDGTLDFYFRQAGWTDVNHLRSVGEPLDGTWRHIVFTQQADGTRALYIDGVKDAVDIPAKAEGAWNLNTTTIGGILRANPTHWVTGLIDDVALWKRALAPEEITTIFTQGTPVPFSKPLPLAIRSFKADLVAVPTGDKVWLRWDVTKNVQVTIDQGVGDVTAQTVTGLGAIEVTVPQSRTFRLTLTRGEETVSETVSVAAIDGIAPGWTLIDNFDRFNVGRLNGQGGWLDLDANDFDVLEVNGNKVVAPLNGGGIAFFRLGPLTAFEGQQRTLFFRVFTRGDENEPVSTMVGITDRSMRFGTDSGGSGNDIGPGAVIGNELGILLMGAPGPVVDYGGFTPTLVHSRVYNVWVDFKNDPFPADQSSTGDTFTVWVQEDGVGTRTAVVTDAVSARNPLGAADVGFATPHLDKILISGLSGQSTAGNVLIDDIYLSKTGYNSTVPRVFGFTTPVSAQPPSLGIAKSAGGIQITWTGSALESSTSITGGWTTVANAASPYNAPAEGTARFYRAR